MLLQVGSQAYGMYSSSRAYCGGCIISAIAYFAYILLVTYPDDSVEPLKPGGPGFVAAITSQNGIALTATTLAFCGSGIQLGSMAAMTSYGCKGSQGALAPFPDLSTDTSRRLLGEPSATELEARCAFDLSVDW